MPFTPDPFGDWIRSHGDELARHAGRFVAIDPDIGIVGVGDDPVALERQHHTAVRPVMVTFATTDGSPALLAHRRPSLVFFGPQPDGTDMGKLAETAQRIIDGAGAGKGDGA